MGIKLLAVTLLGVLFMDPCSPRAREVGWPEVKSDCLSQRARTYVTLSGYLQPEFRPKCRRPGHGGCELRFGQGVSGEPSISVFMPVVLERPKAGLGVTHCIIPSTVHAGSAEGGFSFDLAKAEVLGPNGDRVEHMNAKLELKGTLRWDEDSKSCVQIVTYIYDAN